MNRTWIVVAHRAGARIFAADARGKGLERVSSLEHPAGKLKNREIDSDKQGRAFDRQGAGRHAYTREQEPTEHLATQFAKQIAGFLEDARTAQKYERLVLVAEPRFLGLLRAALDPPVASLVKATLDKDLGGIEDREVPTHLGDIF
jgi:protein required for attachment to host cells